MLDEWDSLDVRFKSMVSVIGDVNDLIERLQADGTGIPGREERVKRNGNGIVGCIDIERDPLVIVIELVDGNKNFPVIGTVEVDQVPETIAGTVVVRAEIHVQIDIVAVITGIGDFYPIVLIAVKSLIRVDDTGIVHCV